MIIYGWQVLYYFDVLYFPFYKSRFASRQLVSYFKDVKSDSYQFDTRRDRYWSRNGGTRMYTMGRANLLL
jgi:hypothetical protein